MNKQKNVFIGLAWPYANGSLHLGHVSAFIGADILARFHRQAGDRVLLVSGSDCYGTPIAVEAAARGIEPSQIADRYHAEFEQTLIEGLGFSYDIYTKTTTDQHARVVQELFLDLLEKELLYRKTEDALYSPYLDRFLPDRFVEGTCPKCKAQGARGDQCDECGSLLDPLELIEPKINPKILSGGSTLSSEDLRLERRASEHFYLKLTELAPRLTEWVEKTSGPWRQNASTFAKGFLRQGLHDRAITRDTDWGVPIPLEGYENKRIYVWFEAVSGYLSASKLWAEQSGQADAWEDFWHQDDALHYYVHGKDNIPFHTIIWPAILLAKEGLHLPDRIVSSEYLTLEGKQFSKSRHWAVWLPEFLAAFDAETLRFFLTMYGPESGDADFSWDDYVQKVNGELIATFGNLVNRTLTLMEKHFPEGAAFPAKPDADSTELLERARTTFDTVSDHIQASRFRAGFREILELAQHANRYIHVREPWKRIKEAETKGDAEQTLAVLAQVISALAVLAHPFLPRTSAKIQEFLGLGGTGLAWAYPHPHARFSASGTVPLFRKIDPAEGERERAKLGTDNSIKASGAIR